MANPLMTTKLTFASYLSPALWPLYRSMGRYLERRLSRRVRMLTGSSFAQFASGEVDLGFIWGLPYVRLMRLDPPPVELLVAPVLGGERYGDRPTYFSDVIVGKDNPAHAFGDLRGSSWSYNDSGSHSGYNVVLYHLLEMGEGTDFFGKIVQAGSHQRSIRLVARGEVDASAIDSQVLAVELREHPRLRARVRVIDSLGPSPIQPVVVASCLDGRLKERLRTALTEMHHDPEGRQALSWGFAKRLEAVVDHDYDPIRRMLEAVEQAGLSFGGTAM